MSRRGRRRWLFRLLVAAIALPGAALLLELGLRAASPPPLFHGWLPAYPHQREERREIALRGVSPVSVRTTNRWGLRGDAPPPDAEWEAWTTVLAVGGSTTQCYYLDDARTWPRLLQERLRRAHGERVWVGNAGFDGHSTRGHLLVMEHVVRALRPDAVLVLVGANDLAVSLSDEHRAQRYDEQNYLSRFRTVQLATLWKQVLFDDAVVVRGAGHGGFQPVPLAPGDAWEPPADPRQALPGLPEYRANLERLVAIAREVGTRLLFLTQPTLFEDTPRWRALEGPAYWLGRQQRRLSGATYRRLLDVYNAELEAVCREQGVPCFDLAARLPRDEEHFYDLLHFTERGAERVAIEVTGPAAELLASPR